MAGSKVDAGGAWLTGERALAWCRVLAVGELVWVVALVVRALVSAHPAGALISADFTCFWSAARLAVAQGPSVAYDVTAMSALEHTVQAVPGDLVAPFLYPPTYLMLCLPLAVFGCDAAALVFVVAGLLPFLLCLRRMLPKDIGWLPILAFPGLMVTAGTEQNGFFSGACFAGGAMLLEKDPFLAGLCLGALTCKPQLALLVPVALLAARRLRALAGAVVSAGGLIVLSWLCLGTQVWLRFPEASREAGRVLVGGLTDPSKLQSVFGAALLVHAPAVVGFLAQGVSSLLATGLLIGVAWRRPGGRAEGAMLATATLAASPYLMDYDLVALAVPLAWLVAEAKQDGWLSWEKYVAFAAYIMPLLTRGVAQHLGIPTAPIFLLAFLLVVAGRAGRLPIACRVAPAHLSFG